MAGLTGRNPSSIGRLRAGNLETRVNTGLEDRQAGNPGKQWAGGQGQVAAGSKDEITARGELRWVQCGVIKLARRPAFTVQTARLGDEGIATNMPPTVRQAMQSGATFHYYFSLFASSVEVTSVSEVVCLKFFRSRRCPIVILIIE